MDNLRLHLAITAALGVSAALLVWAPPILLALPLACNLRNLTGLNCPFCGLTRDFIALAAGEWPSHNVFALALAAAIYFVYPATVFVCAVRRRPFPLTPGSFRNIVFPLLVLMFLANNSQVWRTTFEWAPSVFRR